MEARRPGGGGVRQRDEWHDVVEGVSPSSGGVELGWRVVVGTSSAIKKGQGAADWRRGRRGQAIGLGHGGGGQR
jgi:hypothetical protein